VKLDDLDPTDGVAAGPDSPDPPLALLVCGAPGSGKSTVGALVARQLHAALLDLDTATASLVAVLGDLLGTDNLDDPDFVRLTRAARYEALTALAEDNLAVGTSAVMVAPFSTERRDEEAWSILRRRMERVGGVTTMVWLRISADEVVRRVDQRGAGRDRAKQRGDWSAGLDLAPPAVPHLVVDALLSPATMAERVLSLLPRPSPDGGQ
jgi:predicted kinase